MRIETPYPDNDWPCVEVIVLQICFSKPRMEGSKNRALKTLIHYASTPISQTYPADCRKIAAVDSNKHDWD